MPKKNCKALLATSWPALFAYLLLPSAGHMDCVAAHSLPYPMLPFLASALPHRSPHLFLPSLTLTSRFPIDGPVLIGELVLLLLTGNWCW